MNARLREIWANATAFVWSLPPQRRAIVLGTGIGSLVLVLGFAWWEQRPLYKPLFTNLAPEDVTAIVGALDAEKVP